MTTRRTVATRTGHRRRTPERWTVTCRTGNGRRAEVSVQWTGDGVSLVAPEGTVVLTGLQLGRLRAALREAILVCDSAE
ncbi:Ig-like domain-containing protein [Amycolatopsis sp. NBC_00345]|uniref:Ig-like domain-containing protein n=1 Tax=Amycolatopsis sp. NBC_00345 TaxID=2975955 RepID=UPI002E26816B